MILFFFSCITTQLSVIYLFNKLTKSPPLFKFKKIMIFPIVGIIQVLLNVYEMQLISTFFTVIYFFVLFKWFFSCNFEIGKNYSLIIWIMCLLEDMLLMCLGNIFNLTQFYEINPLFYKAIATIIMNLLLIIIANVKFLVSFINKLYKKMANLKITMNHITLIVIIYLFIGFMSSENMSDKFVVTILLIVGISILILAILFISMKYQIINYKKTNEILEKNDIVNRKIITQYRILKHNLESQLLGVKTVSNKKAQELIDDLIHEYNSSFYIKHDINDMPSGINGLVFEKLYNYHKKELNITITNKIKKNILEEVGPRSYNLFCEALGVTLDNALESSVKSKEKLIYLEFKESSEKLIIKIMNTFSGHIELDKLGTVQYTSKEKGHGFGLFSLIGRKNLSITTSIKNNLFINLIEVKKKVEKRKK